MMANGDDETGKGHNQGDNIVKLPSLAERDKMRQRHNHNHNKKEKPPAFFNLPPVTQYLAGSIILSYIVTSHVLGWINPFWQAWGFFQFSFIPGRFIGDMPFTFWSIFSPLTYMWLHGGVMHVAMNVVMLVALGTAVERWLGAKYLMIAFLISGVVGAGLHFIFYMHDYVPVIGASGATSGLFGLVILMIQDQRRQYRSHELFDRFGIWPFVAIWLAISIVPAFFTPAGQGYMVAWAVHVGGFLAGIGIYQYIKSSNKR